jgi:dihydrodipicolinate synthase/N-acetylneuraminate lyase
MDASELRARLAEGLVIPAHPLALTPDRRLDERRQRALTRYYVDAGAGGVAVGVHTTQFAIREAGLLEPVLALARGVLSEAGAGPGSRPVAIAGVCGETVQALHEADLARRLGYDAGLLSLAALRSASNAALIAHARSVGERIPIFGFYLQPAVGGRRLDHAFWRAFLEIESVVAIKVAPFNRYQTLDVARALAESGRRDVSLYTGNDDNIVADLMTDYSSPGAPRPVRFAGGLLGQWSVWTRRAVELVASVKAWRAGLPGAPSAAALLALGARLTDANAALFDARNGFAGCIAGLHEILRRQGLLSGRTCLDPAEGLSPGQMQEIDRVLAAFPELTDDAFVAEGLKRWLP